MEKITFIVNPVSGGKNKKKIVEAILKQIDRTIFQPEIIYTKKEGEATLLAKECNSEVVVAVGGDGTINEVAKGIAGTSKVLGVIPCGSGDGFARHLGIKRNCRKAISVINRKCVESVDYALLNNEPFICTTGVGIDALTAFKFACTTKRGVWNYVLCALKVWRTFTPDTYKISIDNEVIEQKAAIITIANIGQWGNNAKIAPLASVTDGLLDVSIVLPFKSYNIPSLVVRLMGGCLNKSKKVKMFKGKKITILREKEGAAHCDGNPFIAGKELVTEVVAGGIKVIVPRPLHEIA